MNEGVKMKTKIQKDIDTLFRIKKSKYSENELTDKLLYILYEEAAKEAEIETLHNGKKQRFFQKTFTE